MIKASLLMIVIVVPYTLHLETYNNVLVKLQFEIVYFNIHDRYRKLGTELKVSPNMAFDLNMAIALDLVNEHFFKDQSSASPIHLSSDGDDENIGDIESLVESPEKSMSNKQADPNSPLSKDVSLDETGVGGLDSNAKITAELEAKLEGGACFGSLEQAHIFYCEYGRQKGFSVRRGDQRYKGTSEDLRWKEFVCYCAGAPYGGYRTTRFVGSKN